jgi:hypothetical protein
MDENFDEGRFIHSWMVVIHRGCARAWGAMEVVLLPLLRSRRRWLSSSLWLLWRRRRRRRRISSGPRGLCPFVVVVVVDRQRRDR